MTIVTAFDTAFEDKTELHIRPTGFAKAMPGHGGAVVAFSHSKMSGRVAG